MNEGGIDDAADAIQSSALAMKKNIKMNKLLAFGKKCGMYEPSTRLRL
jgi:hypothetical protein